MKLLVISDTHTRIQNAVRLIQKINPDYTLHLGDMCEDCERLQDIFKNKIITSVIGNNDYYTRYPDYPKERLLNLEGKKIFMCHGHTYNVKYGLDSLKWRAIELNADVALFGHTHMKHLESTSDLIVMNPGDYRSYGIIEINGEKIDARVEIYNEI